MIKSTRMKLPELSTLIANIPDINADETIKLKDNLVLNYQASVKKSLNEILESQDNDEQKYSALESFLEENWELIKGSLLSYTSIYNTEITKALCKAAESICDFKNSKLEAKSEPFVPLQFLMPGIELFSLIPHYNDLEPVELLKSNSEDQQQLSRLEPGLLKDEKDKLEREKSLFDAQQEHIRQNRFIVKEDYCIPNIPLEIILKTFVLNEDSSSLIPVSVILEDLNLRPYDFSCVVFDEQIKKRTNQRIISHSNETLEIYNAMNKLNIAESDQNHFLGNLTELCKQLKFNDSHSGIGRDDNAGKGAYPAIIAFKEYYDGLEYQLKQWQDDHEIQEGFIYLKFHDNPTKGLTYTVKSKDTGIKQGIIKQDVIEAFFSKDNRDKNISSFEQAKDYKEEILKVIITQGNSSLEDEEKNKIPAEIKNEIEKLLILASDSSRNQNATTNMDTCIGSRREALEKLISNPEQKQSLSEISTSKTSKANLIKNLHSNLQKTKNALQYSLSKIDNYQGVDSLGLSVKLLETFKIDFKIKDLNTLLDIIKDLTKDEILSLCQRDENIEQFINPIKNNIENLTNFVLDCSEDNLKALLEAISKRGYITKLFDSVQTLSTIIDYASNNGKTNIILKSLKDNLKDIIKSGKDFGLVLQYLNETQRDAVYTALKDNLKDIIESGYNFGCILQYLNETQRDAVYTALKDNLKDIIKSVEDFCYVIYFLNETQIIVVCTEFKDSLKNIIKSGNDLGDSFEYLDETQRGAVCTALKDNLKDIIKSGRDFSDAFKYLNETQITSVCIILKDNLKDIIKSGKDFSLVLQNFNEAKKSAVCTALKDNLKDIITSGLDFSDVFQYLNEAQRDTVCSALKNYFKNIIKSGVDFSYVIKYLNETQRNAVYTELKDNLKDTIKSGIDFGYALQYLNDAQRSAVYTELKDNLESIIRSRQDFACLLQYLTEAQITSACIALKDKLKCISGCDFGYVTQYLSETQVTAVYTVLKDNLKEIIKSGRDLGEALQYLNDIERNEVCIVLKDNLKSIITSERDFSYVLMYLNETQKIVVCNALKEAQKDDNDSDGKQLKPKRR